MMWLKIALRQLLRRVTARRPLVIYKLVKEEIPSRVRPNIVYGVTEEGSTWQAALVCPCGC